MVAGKERKKDALVFTCLSIISPEEVGFRHVKIRGISYGDLHKA